MHLNILYLHPKSLQLTIILSWIPLPQQNLFLLQCCIGKIDSLADGRHSNSETGNLILWLRAILEITVPQFSHLDEGIG